MTGVVPSRAFALRFELARVGGQALIGSEVH